MAIKAKEENKAGSGVGEQKKILEDNVGSSGFFKRVIKEGLDEATCYAVLCLALRLGQFWQRTQRGSLLGNLQKNVSSQQR